MLSNDWPQHLPRLHSSHNNRHVLYRGTSPLASRLGYTWPSRFLFPLAFQSPGSAPRTLIGPQRARRGLGAGKESGFASARAKDFSMAGQRLAAGFLQVPAVTRAYTAACVLTTAAVLELLSPFQLYFNPHLVFRKFQGSLWATSTTS
eukprot:XP_017169573.1 PREDICTED: derlin-3 isoform X3 [Mus musculus]